MRKRRTFCGVARLAAAVLATVVFFSAGLSVGLCALARTAGQVREEREQRQREQRETQRRYDEAAGMLGDLQDEKADLQDQIAELDENLTEIMASVSLMEEQIEETKEQIAVATAEYEDARAKEDAQFAAMKLRVRDLYEKGDSSYLQVFLKASDWSDLLNRATYIEKVYEYDRRMLEEYILLKEEVAARKGALEDAESDLETQLFEMQEEKSALEELLEERKALSADYDLQIAKVQQEAAAYKALIKQQNAQIQQLQEEENAIIRAEEERRKAEQARQAGSGSQVSSSGGGLKTVPPATGSTGSDIARYACQFVGNPYVAGGTSLTDGADCSGFIWAVYKQYGYSLPRTSAGMRSAGREVPYDQAQPGDIICYAGHVALYLGGGRIVHAATARSGIKYGYANYRPIMCVRRIVG